MVQNTNYAAKNLRGRPPSFDAETIVADAVRVFWRCGYRATSLAKLEQELGVNRSTLYNSFDGKEGLFQAAVEVYLNDLEEGMFGPLRDGTQGIEDLVAFTDRLSVGLTDTEVPPGCLLVNAMVTDDAPEATARYFPELPRCRRHRTGPSSTTRGSLPTDTICTSIDVSDRCARSQPCRQVRHACNRAPRAHRRTWCHGQKLGNQLPRGQRRRLNRHGDPGRGPPNLEMCDLRDSYHAAQHR